MYYDESVDVNLLNNKNIGIIGYGIQLGQALNLLDSGFNIKIGNQDDKYVKLIKKMV